MATTKMRSLGSGCLSQITTIFLDLDNTLIPTRKADAKACNKVSIKKIFSESIDKTCNLARAKGPTVFSLKVTRGNSQGRP